MKIWALPLALSLAGLMTTNLSALERVRDGGPIVEPAPNDAPAPAPKYAGPAPYGGPGPHQELAKQAKAKADAEAQAATAQPATPVSPPVDASTLNQTIVTAHLREAMVDGKNLLWCNAFQLAWDEAGRVLGQPIQLKASVPMAEALNENLASKADLDEASYLAMAGYYRDNIDKKIIKALDAKFPNHDDFLKKELAGAGDPDDFAAIGYLEKNLKFETPFFTSAEKSLTFDAKAVKSFGVWSDNSQDQKNKCIRQIQVIDFLDETDFVVELLTQAKDDRLILAQIQPASTLKATIDRVLKRVAAAQPTEIGANDAFQMPTLQLNLLRDYTEVVNQELVSPKGMVIYKARQATKFKLNENGAELISQVIILMKPTGMPVKSRHYIFNRPFLVLLQRKDAKMPYFALWIANTELLQPVGAAAATEPEQAKLPPASNGTTPAPETTKPAPRGTPPGANQLQSMPAIAPPLE